MRKAEPMTKVTLTMEFSTFDDPRGAERALNADRAFSVLFALLHGEFYQKFVHRPGEGIHADTAKEMHEEIMAHVVDAGLTELVDAGLTDLVDAGLTDLVGE
jgi:hypothetical protein